MTIRHTGARIPQDLHRRFKAVAVARGEHVSALVARWLRDASRGVSRPGPATPPRSGRTALIMTTQLSEADATAARAALAAAGWLISDYLVIRIREYLDRYAPTATTTGARQ